MLILSFFNRLLPSINMAKLSFYVFSIIVLIDVSYANANSTYTGDTVVMEDDPFTITCLLSPFETLKWQKDGFKLVASESNNITFSEIKLPGGGIEARLFVTRAHLRHSGRYKCNSFHSESQPVFVISANDIQTNKDFGNYKVLHPYKTLSLVCNVSSPDANITWLKGNKPIEKPSRANVDDPTTLKIADATEADVDNYTCVVNHKLENGSTIPTKEEFIIIVKPTARLPKTKSVVEGEELVLNCSVTGRPTPTVTWIIGNLTLNETFDRYELTEDRGVPNAILTIKESRLEDRGDYICTASNLANSTETRTFVRVKDKLAALWPFLGICAEVFVLCLIILIYEKRRNKAELEESDTDQSPEQKNAPDMGKDSDVRHRK